MISLASAAQAELSNGFKQGDCILIKQVCGDCDYSTLGHQPYLMVLLFFSM